MDCGGQIHFGKPVFFLRSAFPYVFTSHVFSSPDQLLQHLSDERIFMNASETLAVRSGGQKRNHLPRVTPGGKGGPRNHPLLRISVQQRQSACFMVGRDHQQGVSVFFGKIERDAHGLVASGASRRFAFRQHWRIAPVDGGIRLSITLEADEPIEVQEYHVSAGLLPAYARWETDCESGAFPPVPADARDWTHLNRDYRPGVRVRALSPELPSVMLLSDAPEGAMRPTAINADYQHQTRVLQALRVGEGGPIVFPAGVHTLFAGRLLVEAAPADGRSAGSGVFPE